MADNGNAARATSSEQDGRLSFNQWRTYLFADAEVHGVLANAQQLGDYALRLFWEQGMAPSVDAIVESGKKKGSRSTDATR
jgi:hypothetical protein